MASVNPYSIKIIGDLDTTKMAKQLRQFEKNTRMTAGGKTGKGGFYAGIGKDAQKATKGIKGFNGEVVKTNKQLKSVKGSVHGKTFRTIGVDAQQSAKAMHSFGTETLNVTKKVIQFGAVTAVIRGVTSGMADMVQNVFELDAALTEFKKVSDLSGKGLERYTDQAYRTGREVAKTGSEMIQAATEFKKSGFNEQDSMKLGKIASMYQNVADQELTAGEAANFIVSQMKAYNMEAKDAEHIIDAVNEVSNNFAVSSADIATNIGKASAAMSTGNVTYEQSIGLLTAMTEITRNGAKGARGLISIQSRYNQIVDESSSTGKKLTAWYKEHNIAIKDQNGQLRSFYDVGKDVAEIWDTLSDNEKRYYLNTQAGANQSQNLAALMKNYSTAIDATETALRSENSASKENARYMESLQGHLQELKSAWEEFSHNLVNSDLVKGALDVLTNVLKALNTDVGQFILKAAILSTIFGGIARGIFKLATAEKTFSILSKAINLFNLDVLATSKSTGLLGKALSSMLGKSGLDKGLKTAGTRMLGLAKSAGLWSAGILGASLAISGGLRLYQKWIEDNDKVIQQEKEVAKATKEWHKAQKDIQNTKSKIRDKQQEIRDLEEKRKNGGLSQAEEENLDVLKLELETQKEILALQEKREARTWKKQEQTIGKKGLSATDFITMGREGWTAQETWENLYGVSTKAGKALVEYQHNARDARVAQEELDAATEHLNRVRTTQGHTEEDLTKAEKAVEKAQGKVEKAQESRMTSLQEMLEKKKEYDDYLAKGNTLTKDELKDYKKVNKAIEDNAALHDLSKKATSKDMKAIVKYGDAMGVISKDGKKINQIKLGKFTESMLNAGKTAEDVQTYLEKIKKTNPDAKITLGGAEVAESDLSAILQYLEAVDSNDPNATVTIGDTQYAVSELKLVDGKLQDIDGKTVTANVKVDDSGAKGKTDQYKGSKKAGTRTVNFKADTKSVSKAKSTWSGSKKIGTRTVEFKAVRTGNWKSHEAHGVRHFASGGMMDNAEVNEQGFEIIQDSRTGLMRVVNGGKRGTTYLNRGDTVYTHGQSVRMLREAGQTEGSAIYGHGNKDFGISGVKKPEGYAKGLTKKQYKKKYKAITSAFDKELAKLEYKRDYYHWSNEEYAEQYTTLYDKYNAKLASLNKQKVKKGVSRNTTLGTDRVRAYNLAQSDVESEQFKENIESTLKDIIGDATGLEAMLKAIEEADKAQRITADETAEFIKEAYKTNAEYNMKQFQNNKETYVDMRKLLEDYYADGKISGEDYYDFLDELAEEQLDKEKERLSERLDKTENTYDLAKAYVQRQIDLLETENEEQEKQNELVELQNNLAKARNQRIRIYKEGEGFVYEQDTDAIREATQALQDYQSESAGADSAVNPVLKQWQDILDLFDDLEADYELKALENKVGSTVGALFGGMGTSTSAWSDWIKNNLSTSYGLQDVLDQMDKLVDTEDILGYLDQNGKVTDAIIDAAIGNNILPATYAAAITQAAQGIGAIANTGASIATQSTISSLTSGAIVMSGGTQYGNVYNFDNLVLPNVTNATEFVNSLDNLPNTALQVSTQRN